MKENGLGKIFLRHLAMAAPWGIILLIVFFIAAIGVKQQMKEGIQYAIRTSISEAANLVYGYNVVVPVKKNIKEGIEFLAKTARNELKAFLNDPVLKQDMKEALEYGSEKFVK
jgi:hypothetical protein